jgi:MOSC domain-containing protein YiiM
MYRIGPARYTTTDARRTFFTIGPWWRQLVDQRDGSLIDEMADELAGRLAAWLPVARSSGSLLVDELEALGTLVDRAIPDRMSDHDSIEALLGEALRTLAHAGEALRAAGQMPPRTIGQIVQLHRSGGGVPKQPVDDVEIGFGGVVGDVQRSRQHHGRPWQALCIWSDEVIESFRAGGHPLARGFAGENITISGIPWQLVRAGTRLRIGTALAEISVFALPCKHNAPWFLDGDFRLMHHDRGPVSRVYATVLEPGHAVTGDEVVLEP